MKPPPTAARKAMRVASIAAAAALWIAFVHYAQASWALVIAGSFVFSLAVNALAEM